MYQSALFGITIFTLLFLLYFNVFLISDNEYAFYLNRLTFNKTKNYFSNIIIPNTIGYNHSLLFPFYHHHFNCSAIINGNLAEIRRAERYVDNKVNVYVNWTNLPCENLIYANYSNSSFEKSFPLAFSIIAYKNSIQVLRLFRTLYRSWNRYCFHVDAKSKDLVIMVEKLHQCFPNVILSPVRENVKWGEISLLKAALHCVKALNTENPVNWKYLLNIAGSDYPLKSNLDIVRYLTGLNGTSDVQDLADDDAWKYKYSFKNGISKQILDDLKSALKNGTHFPTKSPFSTNLNIRKGSFSGAFEKKFVDFLCQSDVSLKFLDYLNDTFIPDEAYWSTMYHGFYKKFSSPRVVIDLRSNEFSVRYTHWGNRKPYCSGLSEHGLCVYGLYDLKWLLKMKHLFAHKFDEKIQPITLDCMEEYVYNLTFIFTRKLNLNI